MADRLTSADYVLIHAVGRSVCSTLYDPQWEQLTTGLMTDALSAVTGGNAMMQAFAQVARDLIAAGRDAPAAAAAQHAARDVLLRYHERRMAEAWDIFKKGKSNGD